MKKVTRGVRNNNPFNIIVTGDRWQGQLKPMPNDKFVRFRSIDYGIRAGINLLRTYIIKGYDTPRKIVFRYAPPSENESSAYLNYVLQEVSTGADDKIRLSSLQFYELCHAICMYESKYDLSMTDYDNVLRRFRII